MATVTPDYGFDAEKTSDGFKFTIGGEPLGSAAGCHTGCILFLLGGLAICFLAAATAMRDNYRIFGILPVIVIGVIIVMIVRHSSLENKKRRAGSTFEITKNSVLKDDKQYDLNHISKIYASNIQGHEIVQANNSSGTGFIIGGLGPVGLATLGVTAAATGICEAGAAMARGIEAGAQKEKAAKGYYVAMLYGANEVKLASHLLENTALMLMDKIIEAIQGRLVCPPKAKTYRVCPKCHSELRQGAFLEDGSTGDWCPTCNMSIKRMQGEI